MEFELLIINRNCFLRIARGSINGGLNSDANTGEIEFVG